MPRRAAPRPPPGAPTTLLFRGRSRQPRADACRRWDSAAFGRDRSPEDGALGRGAAIPSRWQDRALQHENSDVDTFNDYRIAAYSLDTMQRKILVEGGTKATYLSTRQLVYVRAGSLWVAPFDRNRWPSPGRRFPFSMTCTKMPLMALRTSPSLPMDLLPTLPEGSRGRASVVWVDRQGNEEALPLPPHSYLHRESRPTGGR